MGVLGELFERGEGVGHAIPPVAQDASGGGAGSWFGGFEHALEEVGIDDVVPLMDPKRLHYIVFIGRVAFIERSRPLIHGGDDFEVSRLPSSIFTNSRVWFSGSWSRASNAGIGWPSILAG